jgi:hypothetical protein
VPHFKWLVILPALAMASCRATSSPVRVAVVFQNSWRVGSERLTSAEQSLVKTTALETLRRAYGGFGVAFTEGDRGTRIIRVEDTPYGRMTFGAAGVTYPASTASSVRFDVLANAELAVARCSGISGCAKTRRELLEGLGRGVGATAAHELGHQAGLEFARDSACDDCYDGKASMSSAHFFGAKRWSDEALAAMKRLLPPAPAAQ